MSQAILNHVTAGSKSKAPNLLPGATVRVYQKIKEGGKERVQMFQGLVIRVNAGAGVNKTFTVRKIVDGVGVEKIFPFHSPTIEKIALVKQGKVRRAKLYYMRSLRGKSARIREKDLILSEEVEEETPIETPVSAEAAEASTEPAVEEEVLAEEGTPTEADEPVADSSEEKKTE